MSRSRVLALAILVCVLSVSAGEDKKKNEMEIQELAKQIDKGSVADRVKALQSAADLGRSDAKPLLQNIVSAMTVANKEVKAAATDTLKTLDENLHGIAVKLLANPNQVDFEDLKKQGADAIIPLAPLLVRHVQGILAVRTPSPDQVTLAASSLVLLFEHAPKDALTHKIVLKALKYPQVDIQYRAAMGCSRIPDLQEALPDVLRIAKTSSHSEVRKEAIRSAAVLADEKNKPVVVKALQELRFDKNEEIRKEIEDALSKLKDK